MHTFFRSSLFLYEVVPSEPTPIIVYWRATVFTFSKGASKRTLRHILSEFSETGDLIEPKGKSMAWEKRQVSSSLSSGLGFYWVRVSRSERYKGVLVEQDDPVGLWNLSAYEKADARLGYSEFLREAARYGRNRYAWKHLGLAVKSFWEWLTR
jgi:hypothetical protein